MTRKDIPVVHKDDAAMMLKTFSSGFRDRFSFFHAMPEQDARALSQCLYRESVVELLDRCSVNGRVKDLLLGMSPEAVLDSLAADAMRIKDRSMTEEIRNIRQTFSPHSLKRISSSRGVGRDDDTPISFWIQLGKGGEPYLRAWAGLRFGACSPSGLPREFLRKTAGVGKNHRNVRFLSEYGRYIRASLKGKVYALAVESELRFFIPLSSAQRKRYEYALDHSSAINGERVRYALAPMLHEIVCSIGLELPCEPYLAGGLVRDASPLDLPA